MKRIISLLLIITVLACGMINAAADTPSVYIEGIENGQTIAYGEEISFYVSAPSDTKTLVLYLNGEEYATSENALENFTLSDVPSGRNVLKAEATSLHGAVSESDTLEFFYVVIEEGTISFDDFEDEATRKANWKFESTNPRGVYEEVDGDYALVTYHDNSITSNAYPKLEATQAMLSKLPASEFTLEFDTKRNMWHDTQPVVQCKMFMFVDGGSNYIGGMPRETYTSWKPSLTLGTNGEPYQVMTNNVWYHVKYVIDISKGSVSMYWAEGKGNTEDMASLGTHKIDKGSKITRFSMEFNGYGAQMPAIMIDNILIRQAKTSAYLNAPLFEVYGETIEAGKTPANPTSITVPFSTSMEKSTVTSDVFNLTSDGEDVEIAKVNYDNASNQVTLIPKYPLVANKSYKLNVKNSVVASNGLEIPTDLVLSFKTPFNDFDILKAVAVGDAGPVDIDNISAGDTLSFECQLQNKSADPVEGVVIFAVYENNILSHIDVNDLYVMENAEMAYAPGSSPYTFKAKPDKIEVFVWKSMNERISLAPSKVLE